MSRPARKIHILGLGAIGGLLAVRLSQNHVVCAILRNQSSTPELYAANKGKILHLGYRQSVKIPLILAVSDAAISWQLTADKEPIDNLLITTKSFHVRPALTSVLARLHSNTPIVLMQNGLGSQFQMAEQFPNHLLFAATTTEAANLRQTGSAKYSRLITHAGAGVTRIGGMTAAAKQTGCKALVRALKEAGLRAYEEADIWQALWQKFAVNCGINAYTAIIGCRNGELRNHDLFQQTIRELCEELAKILAAAGYPQSADIIEQRIRQVARATSNNVSSMLQDIRAGRQTEIDAINGFAVQYAQQRGFSVPVNLMLTQKIHQLILHQQPDQNRQTGQAAGAQSTPITSMTVTNTGDRNNYG